MKRTKICTIALLIIVAFILCNSLIPGETSNAISDRVTAIVDETIQIFTDRSSMIKDVWIDCGGFATGVLILVVIKTLCRSAHKAKEH